MGGAGSQIAPHLRVPPATWTASFGLWAHKFSVSNDMTCDVINDTWNLPMTVINDVDTGHLMSSSSCTRAGGKCSTGKDSAPNPRFGGGSLI